MDADKRTAILIGVWQVIASGGIAAVSFRSVATASGVSVGRVQYYFPTKTELVRASVHALLEAAQQAYPDALGAPEDPATLWTLLTHSFTPAADSRAGTAVYYSYVAAGVGDPWIARALAEARSSVVEYVARCLTARYPTLTDHQARARELVMTSEGATQAVFLGWATSDQAYATINQALDRAKKTSRTDA